MGWGMLTLVSYGQESTPTCAVAELPFVQDFSTSDQLNCWNFSENMYDVGISEYQTLNFYLNGGIGFLTLPVSDMDINELSFSISTKIYLWPNSEISMEFGVMAEATEPGSFIAFKSQTLTGPEINEEQHLIYFSNVPETHNLIAIKFVAEGSNGFSAILDDVQLDLKPCFSPGEVKVIQKTAESVEISWTEMDAAEEWELSYGEEFFFEKGLGTTLSLNERTQVISGLESGKRYEFYLRSICKDDVYSEWVGPASIYLRVAGDNCEMAIDLNNLESPFSISNKGAFSDFNFCSLAQKNDLIFYYDLEADAALEIWSDDYYFAGNGVMRWGDVCPGENEIICSSDANLQRPLWRNNTGSTQRVWFLIGGNYIWNTNFKLQWNYYSPGSCLMSPELTIEETTTQTARISWDAQYGGDSWEVVYGPGGFDPGTAGEKLNVNTPQADLLDLSPSTQYDAYVTALCGESQESSSTKISFWTECGLWNMPVVDPLDHIRCWNRLGTSATSYIEVYDGQLRMRCSNTTRTAVTPEVATSLNGKLLSFDGRLVPSTNGKGQLEVGVMENASNLETFITQETFEADEINTNSLSFKVLFQDVPETHKHIGFRLAAAGSSDEVIFYLDNLVLEEAASCIPPRLVRRADFGNDLLVVEWEEMGQAEQWEVLYGPEGFDPKTEGTPISTNTNRCELRDLLEGQSYDFYVRTACGSENFSSWTGPTLIKQPIAGDYCLNAIDLSSITSPFIGSFAQAENNYSFCNLRSFSDLVFYYDVEPGAAVEFVQLLGDHSNAASMGWGASCPGENQLYCEANPLNKTLAWLNETTETQRVWVIYGMYNSPGIFALHWEYHQPGHCLNPTDLTATELTQTSARLSWEDRSGAGEWELVYGLNGFDKEKEGTRMVINKPEALLEGLQPSSAYNYFVRSICGEEVSDSWSSSAFKTECGPLLLPFKTDFPVEEDFRCWKYLSSSWNSPYYSSNMCYYDLGAGVQLIHVLPEFAELPSGTTVRISPARYFSSTSRMDVGTMSDPNDATTFVTGATFDFNINGVLPIEFAAYLENVPEAHRHIALRITNFGDSYTSLAITKVEIDAPHVCVHPGNFKVADLTPKSAVLEWDAMGFTGEWQIRLVDLGTDEELSLPSQTTSNSSLLLENLLPGSFYQASIRPVCEDEIAWSAPLDFRTITSCPAPELLSAERISGTSALVRWSEPESEVEHWILNYYDSSFGNGKSLEINGATEVLLEDLLPLTTYRLWLGAVCSALPDDYTQLGVFELPVYCDEKVGLPYHQTFSSGYTNEMPECWQGLTSAGTLGELGYGYFSSRVLQMELRSNKDVLTAVLPEFELAPSELRISFKAYHTASEGISALKIGVLNEDDFHDVQTINFESDEKWYDYQVNLDDVSVTEGRLAFRAIGLDGDIDEIFYISDVLVEQRPETAEPYSMFLSSLNPNEGTLNWRQHSLPEKVELLTGIRGFDPETAQQMVVIDGASLSHHFTDLASGTTFDAYLRNVTEEGSRSAWAGPLTINVPCQQPEVTLEGLEQGQVIALTEEVSIGVNITSPCAHSPFTISLFCLDDEKSYDLGTIQSSDMVAKYELNIPQTLWGGTYVVRLRYSNYNSDGIQETAYTQSESFVLENALPRIEIMQPAEHAVAVVHSKNQTSSYSVKWNTYGFGLVKVEYTLDGGQTWKSLNDAKKVSYGYRLDGYESQTISIPYTWVGKKIQFRVSSTLLPEYFDVSEELTVLGEAPFQINQVSFEIPKGTLLEIPYEQTFPGTVRWELFDNKGRLLQIESVFLEDAGGNIVVKTDNLLPGNNYDIGLNRLGSTTTIYVQLHILQPTHLPDDQHSTSNIMVYPVPVKDLLYVNAPTLNPDTPVLVYDLAGRKLITTRLHQSPLNVSHLNKGVYLVVIDGQAHKVIKR